MKQNSRNHNSDAEVNSWAKNSDAIFEIVKDLPNDIVIALEINSPVGGRIDCMLFGEGRDEKKNIVHIELKQWSNENIRKAPYSDNLYQVFIGGSEKDETHPCSQAEGYDVHLRNFINLFDNKDQYGLIGLAYCYNYDSEDGESLLFKDWDKDSHISLFSKDKKEDLKSQLKTLLANGKGESIYNEFVNSRIRPTKNLILSVANMFDGNEEFRLLDSQEASCERIFAEIKKCREKRTKSVIIVNGGPGTGKTVIALKILAKLAQSEEELQFYYATRSSALKKSLNLQLRKKHVAGLIKSVYDFKPRVPDKDSKGGFEDSEIDLLMVDEAHRIAKKGNNYSNNTDIYTHLTQTLSLIYCSKVTVFFIDNRQGVRPDEIGTSEMLNESASHYAEYIQQCIDAIPTTIKQTKKNISDLENKLSILEKSSDKYNETVLEIEKKKRLLEKQEQSEKSIASVPDWGDLCIIEKTLKAQFRCGGSDLYLKWIDNVFTDIDKQKDIQLDKNEYDFRIFDSPTKMFDTIKGLDIFSTEDENKRQIARVVAGWCWPWVRELDKAGRNLLEVQIGSDFKKPWETKIKPKNYHIDEQGNPIYLAPNPELWAIHQYGVNQIGCNPSSQGFEFDYVGVILGPDIKVGLTGLEGVTGINYDKTIKNKKGKDLTILIRNIYRVLMTRGKKGCYIYCCDPEVAEYFRKYLPKG